MNAENLRLVQKHKDEHEIWCFRVISDLMFTGTKIQSLGFVYTYHQRHYFWAAHLIFLTDRTGVQSILPIKVSITIDTMLNFDGDFHGHNDVKYKQILRPKMVRCKSPLTPREKGEAKRKRSQKKKRQT